MSESLTEKLNRLAAQRRQAPQPAPVPPSSPAPETEASKDEQRRARTHRLVQIGALTDQYLGSSQLSPEQIGELLSRIAAVDQVRKILQG